MNGKIRGGGKEIMCKIGEGPSRTCIKDTRTKPKEVGSKVGSRGGGWWGENGDNCT